MAIYFLSVSFISRSRGQSAIAAAAYRSGSVIVDERTGETHNCIGKDGVKWTGIVAPEGSPNWVQDRTKFWNAVEAAETRRNSRVAREIILGLPHELNFDQRKALVVAFVEKEFIARGMVADIAMHEPDKRGDPRNYHCHIMLSPRRMDASRPNGFARTKDPDWGKREMLKTWQASWAALQNQHLREHLGLDAPCVDHRSYADRGSDKLPGLSLGRDATAMERRGIETEKGSYNRSVAAWNARIDDARRRQREIEAQVENRRPQGFEIVRNYAYMEQRDQIMALSNAQYRLKKITDQQKAMPGLKELNAALYREVLTDAQQALRDAKRDQQAARHALRRFEDRMKAIKTKSRSLTGWITNPRRMLLLKRIEIRQRTNILKDLNGRAKDVLRLRAEVAVRREWLQSSEGKAWWAQKTQAVRELRIEERIARRDIALAEHERDGATRLAELAYQLKNLPPPHGAFVMDIPTNPINLSEALRQMGTRVEQYVRSLPPDIQQKLAKALEQSLGKEHGYER